MAQSPPLANSEVSDFLQQPRPAWSKVRWINVEGVSWDVLEVMARQYDLHPLAVEDVVHIPQRIKCDVYDGFIYVSMILLTVDEQRLDLAQQQATLEQMERLEAARANNVKVPMLNGEDALTTLLLAEGGDDVERQGRRGSLAQNSAELRAALARQHRQQECAGTSSTAGTFGALQREINVLTEQISLFLLRDGTLISIFQCSGESVTRPILDQVQEQRTLLRDSQDPSFLLNLLLDAIVDHSFPVVDAYGKLLRKYEEQILVGRPDASVTRKLHVIQGDMRLLRHTVMPANAVLRMLRSHDVEFISTVGCGASAAGSVAASSLGDRAKIISELTRLYLKDVQDHLFQLLEEMEALGAYAKDCIDLCFNLTSHATNQAMQTLAVVSAVFLPITFLAGVYGTNFDVLPELHWHYGYAYFWLSCIVITIVFVLVIGRLGLLRPL